MEFFRKKHCDVCGEKISLLGNKKLKDGNMCKNSEKLLSPYFDGRRKTNLLDIKDHLAYREENKKSVALFNPTRSIGSYKRVILDDFSEKFIVTSSNNWQNENPDIIDIFVDATLRIGGRDYDELAEFLKKVNQLSKTTNNDFTFTISTEAGELPSEIFDFAKRI